MVFLKYFIKQNKFLVFQTSLIVGIQTLIMLYLPYLIAIMINSGILENNREVIFSVGVKMLLTLVVETIFGLWSCYLGAELASRFGRTSRKLMVRKIQKLKVDEVKQYGVASLVTRMGADNVNVQQMIVSFFQMVLPGPLIGISAIYMTYILSPELVLIPIGTVVLFVIIVALVLFKSIPYIEKVQLRLDKMTKVFREFLMGVRIIRAFDQSDSEEKRVGIAFGDYAENNIRINVLFAVLSPVAYTLMVISMALVLWAGSILVAQSYLEIGIIAAVLEYTGISIAMLIMSSLVLFQLPKATASLSRISEVINHEVTLEDIDKKEWTLLSARCPKVVASFADVSMSYHNNEENAISGINLTLERGKTLAIVGATGSGKTTIVKNLLRLNERNSGSIKIHGQLIERIPLENLRDYISYVPQRNFLFRGTIKENISFSNKTADMTDVLAAAKVAQAHEFITKGENGYEGYVAQGGTNFSGGQRERLAIARALFKKADIYVFDDSFSALDYATDVKVRQGIQRTLRESAVLIVAQRIQSIIDADEIIVMDKGEIVGSGKHSELLPQNEYYRKIARSQGLKVSRSIG